MLVFIFSLKQKQAIWRSLLSVGFGQPAGGADYLRGPLISPTALVARQRCLTGASLIPYLMHRYAAGQCLLVEGRHLNIAIMPAPATASTEIRAAQQALTTPGDGELNKALQLRSVPDPPLVLYCIRSGVLHAEKLRPMFSTPNVPPPPSDTPPPSPFPSEFPDSTATL